MERERLSESSVSTCSCLSPENASARRGRSDFHLFEPAGLRRDNLTDSIKWSLNMHVLLTEQDMSLWLPIAC